MVPFTPVVPDGGGGAFAGPGAPVACAVLALSGAGGGATSALKDSPKMVTTPMNARAASPVPTTVVVRTDTRAVYNRRHA